MGWVFFLIKTSATYALSVLVAKSPYCYSIENLYVHQEWGEIIFPLYYTIFRRNSWLFSIAQ